MSRAGATSVRWSHVDPNMGDGVVPDPMKAVDLDLAKRVWKALNDHYPNQFWRVTADHKQGIVTIALPSLMQNWKYVMKIGDIDMARMTAVIRVGGDVLERFNLPRAGFDPAQWVPVAQRFWLRNNKQAPGGHRGV